MAIFISPSNVSTKYLMRRSFCTFSLTVLLTSCTSNTLTNKPPTDPRQGSVTKQDFFFYSCMQHYMQMNAIRVFDGSVAYAVEFSDLSSEELTRIHQSAKSFAETLPKPDYADQEHGLPAVLVACQKQPVEN